MTSNSNIDLYTDNDEGLLVRETRKWTVGKIYFLARYIARFIVSMKGLRQHWHSINYIDLFSGPGKNRSPDGKIILGSPLIALTQKQLFDRYYFSDLDENNIIALRQRCNKYTEHTKIMFKAEDANIFVDEVVDDIKKNDSKFESGKWSSSLNLAFLDPNGLELHWRTVARLAELRTDLIIYYSQMGISRNVLNEINLPPDTSIDLFFGDTAWRNIYKNNPPDNKRLHRALLDYYKNKLGDFGYKVEDPLDEPVFRNSKEAPIYRLLFVSKHPLGNKFWTDVTKRYFDGQERLF